MNDMPDLATEKGMTTFLSAIATGKRIAINPQNHQRILKRVNLLNYVFYAATMLNGKKEEEIIQDILTHLRSTSQLLSHSFGVFELNRLNQSEITVNKLNPGILEKFKSSITEQEYNHIAESPIGALNDDLKNTLQDLIGTNVQNMLFRHVLLSNINNLWIEHLTQMEALRVSIGLESFAQRDPLVQYKNRSTDMFSDLLANIRLGVMSQIFRLQPVQRSSASPSEQQQEETPKSSAEKTKKRRRRR
ncbi:MAG: hypothetical protein GYA52_02415 [Chloroflexi bacterium]|nr:hypothetical protein [Chloroflexota bacterium]